MKAIAEPTADPAGIGRMKTHTVTGGGGLRLHIREWGNPDAPPIAFIHGLSQSHLCWQRQVNSPLRDEFRLVAFDLRGHGMSDAPCNPSTTPTPSCGPTTWRPSSRSCSSSGRY